MRLDDTGAVDSDFATSGTWNGSPLNGRLHAVSVQNDGRIIAAGAIDDQGISNLAVVRLANTVTTSTTTTVAATTSTTVAHLTVTTTIPLVVTTIAPDQLPATGQQVNVLTVPVALFGLGILLLGMRRRALR
jgi:hypothetical protein